MGIFLEIFMPMMMNYTALHPDTPQENYKRIQRRNLGHFESPLYTFY